MYRGRGEGPCARQASRKLQCDAMLDGDTTNSATLHPLRLFQSYTLRVSTTPLLSISAPSAARGIQHGLHSSNPPAKQHQACSQVAAACARRGMSCRCVCPQLLLFQMESTANLSFRVGKPIDWKYSSKPTMVCPSSALNPATAMSPCSTRLRPQTRPRTFSLSVRTVTHTSSWPGILARDDSKR